MANDPRVRPAIDTFLSHFIDKYVAEFKIDNHAEFEQLNRPVKRGINLLNMTSDANEVLSEQELRDALVARGVYASRCRQFVI